MLAAIVLAAGASARLGQPKQLLDLGGGTLLQNAITAAREAGCDKVIVILGAHAEVIAASLRDSRCEIVQNHDWARGMGTSIRAGLNAVGDATAALIMTCDQPRIDAAALIELIAGWQAGTNPIAAAEYAGTLGVPAIFARSQFQHLLALEEADGAKQFLRAHPERVTRVALSDAAMDIDTPSDLETLAAGFSAEKLTSPPSRGRARS